MHYRILDLDGAMTPQTQLQQLVSPELHDLKDWGRKLRMACRWGSYRKFEAELAVRLQTTQETTMTWCGSGDFHHISYALLRQLQQPCNLLVLDKHPDWMRAIPFLHCGTWLYHATQLPQIKQIFHVGGELDFDNAFQWLAPIPELRSGKIQVFPAERNFRGGIWNQVTHPTIRPEIGVPTSLARLEKLLDPHREQLARWPLYISFDKDVMPVNDAIVNWDSGQLRFTEIQQILDVFCQAAQQRLAGVDLVGDWSPVAMDGMMRRWFHWTEHPALQVDADDARQRNEVINLATVQTLNQQLTRKVA